MKYTYGIVIIVAIMVLIVSSGVALISIGMTNHQGMGSLVFTIKMLVVPAASIAAIIFSARVIANTRKSGDS
jgi:hypothetical protein